jgi:hypothetical protein
MHRPLGNSAWATDQNDYLSPSSLGSGRITFRCRLWFARNRVSDQPSARKANTPEPGAEPLPGGGPVLRLKEQRPSPWHSGALFHVSTRYPRKPRAAGVDRLAGILRNGLLAPAYCPDGSVCSDLNLVVTGTAVPYDSLVFLHRFGPQSLCEWKNVVFPAPFGPVIAMRIDPRSNSANAIRGMGPTGIPGR